MLGSAPPTGMGVGEYSVAENPAASAPSPGVGEGMGEGEGQGQGEGEGEGRVSTPWLPVDVFSRLEGAGPVALELEGAPWVLFIDGKGAVRW